nr:hypothetical protein GCM10020092_030040 [Actinoplanes digitatis]
MSVRGVARELSHAYESAYTDPGVRDVPGATAEPPHPLRIDDTIGCDRFAARVVRGIDPSAPSPEWMQRRLITAGIRTISLAVDITNYVMLELGQPMHVFDLNLVRGGLVVRRARTGEKLTTLDGVARVLDAEDMVICDDSGPICLAAVMGGETTEFQPDTVDVLLEAAHWDPVMVGRTARRHKLFSEAAKRWERGVDPQLPLVALQRAVELLTAHAGGTVDERVLDQDHVVAPTPVLLDTTLPARRIGVGYTVEQVTTLLGLIGCAVRGVEPLEVTPPTWRPDLVAPIDLVEEVARLGGFDVIPSVLPPTRGGGVLTPTQRRRRMVGRAMAENGYVEVLSYPFIATGAADVLGLPADDPRRSAVRLTNPISEQEPLLRTSLLVPLLGTLKRNLGRGERDLALYETGTVFLPHLTAVAPPLLGVEHGPSEEDWSAANAIVPEQPWHLAAVLTGDAAPSRLVGRGPRGDLVGRGRGRAHRAVGGRHDRRPDHGTGGRAPAVAPGPVRGDRGRRHRGRVRGRAAPERGRGAGAAEAHLRDGARPGRDPGGTGDPGDPDLHVPGGADRRGAGGRRGGSGGRGRGGAGRGRGRAAGVGPAL